MRTSILLCLIINCFSTVQAQEYQKRFSFAKSYFGVDLVAVPSFGGGTYLSETNGAQSFSRSSVLSPYVNIGATHFWGYADFYVSIPTASFQLQQSDVDHKLDQSVFTGFRVYPFPLREHKFRPFLGYKFSPLQYRQASGNRTYQYTKVKTMVDVGVTYQSLKWYGYLGYNRIINPDFPLYLTRGQAVNSTFPSGFINAGINIQLETTRSNRSPEFEQLIRDISTTNNYGFFIGVGPSSAFTLTSSPRNRELYPYLDEFAMPGIFADLSVGYHFSKWDVMTNLAFRPINLTRESLGVSQSVERRSLVLEAAKGLFDYHGFIPFIGAGISYEYIKVSEKDEGINVFSNSYQDFTPLLLFGWDIRPNNNADWLVLRTNLRYSPFLSLDAGTRTLNIRQLEFNFIQVVIYPQRKRHY